MTETNVLNIEERLETFMTDDNKERLTFLLDEFKKGHFPNVIEKADNFQSENQPQKKLGELLDLIKAVSHAQIGEQKQSSVLIKQVYQGAGDWSLGDLITLGELAFMCDYKLARRILSATVKQMDQEGNQDKEKRARGYLVLGESEEKLEKFVRAIKYYQEGLTYFQADDVRDKYMMLYLHFKIGMLYSALHKQEEAIDFLKKTIDLADDNKDIRAESMVSLAKIYGTQEKNDAAFPYLEAALDILNESDLKESEVHAEALMEMAYYYFNLSQLAEAVPFYKDAIAMYKKLRGRSSRKLGMIYMQYAYCLEHKEKANRHSAGQNYELAIGQLENVKDRELLENALADVIAFFDATKNDKKKREYENKFVKMTNAMNQGQ